MNAIANSNAPITRMPPSFLGAEFQVINSQQPAFQLERSDNGSLTYRCECGIAIKRMGDLRRHWRSRRHGWCGFACLGCRKSYSRKYMLDQHRDVCHQAGHATPVVGMELDRCELSYILVLLANAVI